MKALRRRYLFGHRNRIVSSQAALAAISELVTREAWVFAGLANKRRDYYDYLDRENNHRNHHALGKALTMP